MTSTLVRSMRVARRRLAASVSRSRWCSAVAHTDPAPGMDGHAMPVRGGDTGGGGIGVVHAMLLQPLQIAVDRMGLAAAGLSGEEDRGAGLEQGKSLVLCHPPANALDAVGPRPASVTSSGATRHKKAKGDGETEFSGLKWPAMQLTRAQTAILVAGIIVAHGDCPLTRRATRSSANAATLKLWDFDITTAENSQQLIDWYTPSHVIHGFLFYWLLWLASRWVPLSFGLRLVLAVAIEASRELFENTDFIINHYREMTISLDYHGDSVFNSVSDVLFMLLGFFLAARLPVWPTVVLAIALEVFIGAMIRDNLTLNVLMFLWPLDSILHWQQAR